MTSNIGVNVLETDGRAAPTIVAAPLSVAGLLIRSERGPENVPVALGGLADFALTFGGITAGPVGPHAVRGFFDNGGTDAYAVRILGAGAQAASTDLVDSGGAGTLRVSAGTRGREDPGAWGNALTVAIADHPRGVTGLPAQIVGARGEPFAIAPGATLTVTVNGSAAGSVVTFATTDLAAPGAASAAEIVAAVGRQTTRFRAVQDRAGHLVLAAAVSGPASQLEVTGTAADALGFGTATDTSAAGIPVGATVAAVDAVGGLAVGSGVRLESRGHVLGTQPIGSAPAAGAGITVTVDGATDVEVGLTPEDFGRPGGVLQAISRQARGFTAAVTTDGRLILMSDRYGAASTIALAAGTPDATAALGLTDAEPAPGVSERRALTTVDEPGRLVAWAGPLAAAVAPNAGRLRSAEFDLVIRRGETELERFESVSMQSGLDHYVAAVVNDVDFGSRFLVVEDLPSASGVAEDVPAAGIFPLGGRTAGVDGQPPTDLDYIGDPAERTGLYALDTVDIQLLGCPDTTAPGVVSACLGYVERRGDAMFVGSAPRGLDLDGVKAYAAPFRARKVFGALYAPWIEVLNPLDATGNDPRLAIPPVGHVLGMYARIAQARGVWKAPAGDEAMLVSALGVEFDLTDADHTDLVKNGGVNGVRAIPGSGIVVDASRTLSTDTRWTFVNVRRLFNFVKASLRDGLRWVPQEMHSEDLRRRVKFNVVTPFLLGLWRQGAFGSDPPDQVFTVKCDAENNPPGAVNLGEFRVEVFFYPVKPAETIVITVGQQESGAAAAEA